MDTVEDKKKDLTDRLLAISGEKYLNGIIPLAKLCMTYENSIRLKLLEELIDAGCDDEIIHTKLKVEVINQFELAIIETEISQMNRDGVSFFN